MATEHVIFTVNFKFMKIDCDSSQIGSNDIYKSISIVTALLMVVYTIAFSTKQDSKPFLLPFQTDHTTISNAQNADYIQEANAPVQLDLQQIRERGKLIALTGADNTSYFIYKGSPMGYEYELLTLLAAHLKVDFEIIVVKDMQETFRMLNRGEGDIIADHLIVTKQQDKHVNFTSAVVNTRQVLIQRKPRGWETMSESKLNKKLVKNPIDLMGKKVCVPAGSPYFQRLQHLSEEIGGEIHIVEIAAGTDSEALMAMVDKGKVPFAVMDENTARLYHAFYKNTDIGTPLSFPQRIAWAVRENAPGLQQEVNTWLASVKKQPVFSDLYHKYYLNKKTTSNYYHSKHASANTISGYDRMIMKYAKELGWDWRLLASLIYQESKFNPEARSWVGASGLMQLMPNTAKNFGSNNPSDPEQSIKAGIAYIKWLDKYWSKSVTDKGERLKFIMASYNVGQEHIADAQRLAMKYKKNPQVWDKNVAYYVLQKSKPKYWSDPVVKYGYCRGKETFDYVSDVLQRFNHYKKLVRENA